MTQILRRTQEERSAATIEKLLEATIDSLIDVGYEQTTSRSVAERAGVSRGAMSHHFPRRIDLMVSALDRIRQLRLEAALARLESTPSGAGRVEAMVDGLWTQFTSPLFIAALKLWVAAQEDPELYARLAPIEREMSRTIMIEVERLAEGHDTDFMRRYRFAVSAARGLAVTHAFEPRTTTARDDPWPYHRAVLIRMLQSDT
jgi:AcrR family transcriptional regulator